MMTDPSRRLPSRRVRPLIVLTCAAAVLAGCGRGDSSWNPLRWGGGQRSAPATLEPAAGYVRDESRPPVPQVISARWEPLVEGRLLVVEGIAPTQGWWNAELVSNTQQATGKMLPDPDGVLRLRLLAVPPQPGTPDAMRAARPGADTISAAVTLSWAELRRIDAVEITGAANAITLQR